MKKENRKQKKGISLIALIITIIVIVLLAAIVVNTAITTPQSANFAKFASDMGELQQAVSLEYLDRYTVNPTADIEDIYMQIAGGTEEYNEENKDDILHALGDSSTTAWKVEKDINGISNFPNGRENYYITDKGTIFYAPGIENNGLTYLTAIKTTTSQTVPAITPPIIEDNTAPEGSMAIVNEANPMNATNGISPNIADNITSRNITLDLSASDNITTTENLKIYIKENDSEAPLSDDIGWVDYTGEPMSYTLTTANDGNKIIYVWYKDEAGNVSEVNSDSAYLREWDLSKVVVHNVDGTKIPIPIGYVASTIESAEAIETMINGGLVIKQGSNGAATSGINEFVWIPVPVVTDMYSMNGTEKVGQLWEFANNPATKMAYSDSGLREPAILTYSGYDQTVSNVIKMGITDVGTGTDLLAHLKAEFNNMIESVEKYGGFYIGRYELGYNSGVVCQKNVDVLTANTSSGTNYYGSNTYSQWYGLYNAASTFTTSSVKSTMIGGSQWDRVMNWMIEDDSTSAYVRNSTNKGNYNGIKKTGSSDNYKVKNIYDMAGNVWEWPLEAVGTLNRVARGGCFNPSKCNGASSPASVRCGHNSTYVSNILGSRSVLYIKIREE